MTLCYVIEHIFAGTEGICTTLHKVMKNNFRNLNLSLVLLAL